MLAILKDRSLPVVYKNLLFHSPQSFFQRIKQIHRIHIRAIRVIRLGTLFFMQAGGTASCRASHAAGCRVSYSNLERHEARIRVASEPRQGTAVKVAF